MGLRLDGSSRTHYLRQSVNNTASAGVPKGNRSAIFADSPPCAMPSLRSHSKCLISIFWYMKNNVSAPSGSQFFLSINEHGVIVHGGMIRRISWRESDDKIVGLARKPNRCAISGVRRRTLQRLVCASIAVRRHCRKSKSALHTMTGADVSPPPTSVITNCEGI